jgi:hypothetical protein
MALLGRIRQFLAVATGAVCLMRTAAPNAQGPQPPAPIEANLRAVFLFNFSKYVTWPVAGNGDRRPSEIRICVTANDGFFNLLKAAVQGEDVDGRPLVPIALDGLDAARTCQILYVGDAQSAEARSWLSAVRGRQVLTVADGALSDEVVIAFVRDDNRIRFDINRASAGRRGINVSSKLLRLAREVRDR